MQPTAHAARLGLSRGWTEFRHYLTYPQELGGNLSSSPCSGAY